MLSSWFLVVLYILIMWAYAWYAPVTVVDSWNLLPDIRDTTREAAACQTTSDCPPHHVCMGGTCVPVLLRGESCDEQTGAWNLQAIRGKSFAVCICKRPDVITQKHFGGNCDVYVACGRHGRYDLTRNECDCDEGYAPDPHRLDCRKQTALETLLALPCESPWELNWEESKKLNAFHDDYLSEHRDKKCFKRPCTFDALSGRPLQKYGHFEEGVGCVCDPTKGLFGVRLEANGNYLRTPGYDACASIFTQDLDQDVQVNLYTYFYMLNKHPASFIQFRHVPKQHLIPQFSRGDETTTTIQVGQEFPYDYMQYHLRHKKPYKARTRSCWDDSRYVAYFKVHSTKCSEWKYESDSRINCRDISSHLKVGASDMINYYKLLYRYPVCRIESNDQKAKDILRGRYVVNPHHMWLKRHPNLLRSNGLEMVYRNREWTIDLAEPFDMSTYLLQTEYVPDVTDESTTDLEIPAVGVTSSVLAKVKAARDAVRENEP